MPTVGFFFFMMDEKNIVENIKSIYIYTIYKAYGGVMLSENNQQQGGVFFFLIREEKHSLLYYYEGR